MSAPRRIAERDSRQTPWQVPLLAAAIAGAGAIIGAVINKMPPGVTPKARYTFETGVAGWRPQDAATTRGCWAVSSSTSRHHDGGSRSLEMKLSMNGSDPARSSGEAWVETSPRDLRTATITAWIYAPPGSRGSPTSPNGVQLFIKDSSWRSLYAPWHHVIEGEWFQVTIQANGERPGFIQPGFDPANVVAVGVKFGTGAAERNGYQGSVYVDDVDW